MTPPTVPLPLLPGLVAEPVPSRWVVWRDARRDRATARRQVRTDRRQVRRAARLRRRDARTRWWAGFRPYTLAVAAVAAFVMAGASTGLLLVAEWRPVGVTLVVGGLAAAAGFAVLEWRVNGE